MNTISFSAPCNYGMTISVGMYKKYKFEGITYGSSAIEIIYTMEESLITGCDFSYSIFDYEESHSHIIFANDSSTCITIYPNTDVLPLPKIGLSSSYIYPNT